MEPALPFDQIVQLSPPAVPDAFAEVCTVPPLGCVFTEQGSVPPPVPPVAVAPPVPLAPPLAPPVPAPPVPVVPPLAPPVPSTPPVPVRPPVPVPPVPVV